MNQEDQLADSDKFILTVIREMIEHHRNGDGNAKDAADQLAASMERLASKPQADLLRRFIIAVGEKLAAD